MEEKNNNFLDWTGERYMPGMKGNIEIEHIHRYLSAREYVDGKVVLDIASGEGYGSFMLAGSAHQVIGVDISEDAVLHASSKYNKDNLCFLAGSCDAIPLNDNSIDIAVCFETLEHHKQHELMMSELKRVLDQNGILIISTPDKHEYTETVNRENLYHVKELYHDDFVGLISNSFKYFQVYSQKVLFGSALLSKGGTGSICHFKKENEGVNRSSYLSHSTYSLIVASNNKLPDPKSSFLEYDIDESDLVQAEFEKKKVIQQRHKEEIQSVRQDIKRIAIEGLVEKKRIVKQRDRLLAERNALLSSYSWKLTKPFRFLHDLLTGNSGDRFERLYVALLLKGMEFSVISTIVERIKTFRVVALPRQKKIVDESGLFDQEFYLAENPDIAKTGSDPLLHFLKSGWREGRKPNPCFDCRYYLKQDADLVAAGMNPFIHFIEHGWREGRNPHPLFHTSYYLRQYQDVVSEGVNPLWHFLRHGLLEKRNPCALFDTSYYLEQNPDVAESDCNPLQHYYEFGATEDRNPHPLFDTSYYLEQNPEMAGSGHNPLEYYYEFGAIDQSSPHPLFDTSYYLEQNPDVADGKCNPLAHYVEFGEFEGRSPCDFGTKYISAKVVERYEAWLDVNRFCNSKLTTLLSALSTCEGCLPKISVVMPVYNTPKDWLEQSIASVTGQVYQDWELCIADDCSTDRQVADYLKEWADKDKRIKVIFCEQNGGISRATNAAAALATGDILAFLDHDDVLSPDALAEIALYYAEHPEADLVYSDDDKIDQQDQRYDPQFKPDWSPTLLLSYAYPSHLLTVRRSLFQELKGFRTGFEGSQDYDFTLRATEKARHVGHIPKILYHWRAVPGSLALDGDEKPESFEAGLRAVAEAFERRGYQGEVYRPSFAVENRIGLYAHRFANNGPSVTIIIPTRNRLDLLKRCVESLECTEYENYNVVVVDNDSDDQDTLDYLNQLEHQVLKISNPDGQFSFSHLINQAVVQFNSDYVLFLNNDTEVVSPQWLSQMVGYAQMDGVGAVGAKLLYPDGSIQHAGIVHGYNGGFPGHAFKNLPAREGYLNFPLVAREYSAVTAACMLTSRQLFLDKGGFDEENFGVAYNDVDYCYRLVDGGFWCVYCPEELIHHEGISREKYDKPEELAAVRQKYGLRKDAWYNPNLSLAEEWFQVHPYCHAERVNRSLRVLMFSHNLNFEGAPNILFELCVGLTRRKIIDPVIVSPLDGPLRKAYEEAGIEVKLMPEPDISSTEKFDQGMNRIADFVRQSEAEVVYANTANMFWAVAAAKLAGTPSLWSIHESESWQVYFDHMPVGLRKTACLCFSFPYRVIFVAHATMKVWSSLESRHNFTLIPNGLDLDRLAERTSVKGREDARMSLGLTDDQFVFVVVGTVCKRKGQIDLLKALGHVDESVLEHLHCFIVGDWPCHYSANLHDLINQLPVSSRDQVTMVPITGDVSKYFLAADVAICCSRIESYPLIVLEALAYGLPQIVTPVFGIPEQVREGVNCLFYQPGDVKALGQAISRLVNDEELRAKFKANATSTLASLNSFDEMLEGYGRLFREASLMSMEKLDLNKPVFPYMENSDDHLC